MRRDPLRWAVAGALGLTVTALAMLQARNVVVGAAFAAAVGVVLAVLTVAARLLMRALRRFFPRGWPYALRQGVANLFRPANQTTAVVLALGFAAFLLNVVLVVQHNLLRDLRPGGGRGQAQPGRVRRPAGPARRGSRRRCGRGARSRRDRAHRPHAHPVAQGRGRSVQAWPKTPRGPRTPAEGNAWALRREYRSTYRDTMGSGETVVAGAPWPAGSWQGRAGRRAPLPVSVERELAAELEIGVGDEIVWDVQGVAAAHARGRAARGGLGALRAELLRRLPRGPARRARRRRT